MKRIAALAALVITILAVPATAMASTGGGPAPGQPRAVLAACRLPFRLHGGHYRFIVRVRHRKPAHLTIVCAKPYPKVCRPAVLRFAMAPGSSALTEVSGPVLAPTQEFRYDGHTYTIMSVNPGADSFTVFLKGWLFVNKGAAITNGIGFMGCTR